MIYAGERTRWNHPVEFPGRRELSAANISAVLSTMIPTLLNFALPLATAYAEEQEGLILRDGVPLTGEQCLDAQQAGVRSPERVRLLKVESIPIPDQPALAKANAYVGMIKPEAVSIIFGYGISIRRDHWNKRPLLVHELVHVGQCERLGGVGSFLKAYLSECMTVGHARSPLEREAVTRCKEICG